MSERNYSDIPMPSKKIVYPDTWSESEPGEVLRTLFERIQRDTCIDRAHWARLVDSFIVRQNKAKGIIKSNIVEERSSINKKLKGDSGITFKTMCEALLLMRVKRYRIGLTLENANGTFTEHGVWVNANGEISFDPDIDKDIPIPREVSLLEAITNENFPKRVSTDHQSPPPDLSRFQGTYPETGALPEDPFGQSESGS